MNAIGYYWPVQLPLRGENSVLAGLNEHSLSLGLPFYTTHLTISNFHLLIVLFLYLSLSQPLLYICSV